MANSLTTNWLHHISCISTPRAACRGYPASHTCTVRSKKALTQGERLTGYSVARSCKVHDPTLIVVSSSNDPVKPGKSISKTLIHVKYYFLEPEIQSLPVKTKSTLISVPFNLANIAIFRRSLALKKNPLLINIEETWNDCCNCS